MRIWSPFSPIYSWVMIDDKEAGSYDDKIDEIGSNKNCRADVYLWAFGTLFTCVNIVMFIFNIWILSQRWIPGATLSEHSRQHSLSKLHEERWRLILGEVSPYTAPPSPEVDALWEDISADAPIGGLKIQQRELHSIGKTSTGCVTNSCLGLADVFHHLHCLNYLRKVIYNGTYQMGVDEDPVPHAHIPHCIDSIRLSLQCSADTSIITFHWLENWPYPGPDVSSVHQCRNWDAIKASAMGQLRDVGQLKHPIFGDKHRSHWDASNLPLKTENVHIIADE